jgi:hypothetical protein
VLSFSPLYIRVNRHYFLLILPYAVILLLGLIDYYFLSKHVFKARWPETVLIILLCIGLTFTVRLSMKKTIRYSAFGKSGRHVTIQDDLEVAKSINSVLPPGSPVLVINRPELLYYCNFRPPTSENGYAVIYDKKGRRNIENFDFAKIDYILWNDGKRLSRETFLQFVENTHKIIAEFSDKRKKKIEIWAKKTDLLSWVSLAGSLENNILYGDQ